MQSGINGELIRALSIGMPILALVGGGVCGGNPTIGGALLIVSALGHWYLLGFGTIGAIFILPIGAAGVLGIIAGQSPPAVPRQVS
jgi:hypothetical protein